MATRGRPRKHGAAVQRPAALQVIANTYGAGDLPDLNDPLNRAQAKKVLELAYDVFFSRSASKRLHSADTLRPILGMVYYKYWRSYFTQLQTHGPGRNALYMVQPSKLKALAAAAGVQVDLAAAAAQRGFDFSVPIERAELPRTGDRVYPWWAIMKKEIRHELFLQAHGQGFDHDLRAAKQALLLQYVQRHTGVELPAWEVYVKNPDSLRAELSQVLGVDVKTSKFVIQAVLNGGYAGNTESAIGRRLGPKTAETLRATNVYKTLTAEFKLWLKTARRVNDELHTVLTPEHQTSGEFAAALYTKLEDQVMTVISQELRTRGVHAWYVHDGFLTVHDLSQELSHELRAMVKFSTGFDVSLKSEPLQPWFASAADFELHTDELTEIYLHQ